MDSNNLNITQFLNSQMILMNGKKKYLISMKENFLISMRQNNNYLESIKHINPNTIYSINKIKYHFIMNYLQLIQEEWNMLI